MSCKPIHEDINAWCEFHQTADEDTSHNELANYFHMTKRLRAQGAKCPWADEFQQKGEEIFVKRFGGEFLPF